MELISSRKNLLIREAAGIAGSAEARRESQSFLVEGARLCRDAAESGVQIKRAFFTEKALDKYQSYIEQISLVAKESYIIEEHVSQLLSQTKSSQGIYCLCEMAREKAPDFSGKNLVLEDMQDPANLGTVLRTAEALGINNVVLLGASQDPYSPKLLRASMGAVFRQRVLLFSDAAQLFDRLRQASVYSYGAVVDSRAQKLGEIDFPKAAAVFIGNEGSGLRDATAASCDCLITIPMPGRAESLNAAAAASIIMWEMAGACR